MLFSSGFSPFQYISCYGTRSPATAEDTLHSLLQLHTTIKTLLQTTASSPDSHTVPSAAADRIPKHTTTTTLPLRGGNPLSLPGEAERPCWGTPCC